jgi:cellulose biosynthesis protein BcsQ
VKVLATYNIKGGVGKTATAVNLAYLAAADGYRVLLWDLDPQAAASFLFRIKPRVKGGGKALIAGKRPVDDAIKATDFDNLDLCLPLQFATLTAPRHERKSSSGCSPLSPLRREFYPSYSLPLRASRVRERAASRDLL